MGVEMARYLHECILSVGTDADTDNCSDIFIIPFQRLSLSDVPTFTRFNSIPELYGTYSTSTSAEILVP